MLTSVILVCFVCVCVGTSKFRWRIKHRDEDLKLASWLAWFPISTGRWHVLWEEEEEEGLPAAELSTEREASSFQLTGRGCFSGDWSSVPFANNKCTQETPRSRPDQPSWEDKRAKYYIQNERVEERYNSDERWTKINRTSSEQRAHVISCNFWQYLLRHVCTCISKTRCCSKWCDFAARLTNLFFSEIALSFFFFLKSSPVAHLFCPPLSPSPFWIDLSADHASMEA